MKRAAAAKLVARALKRGMTTNDADQISLAVQLLKDMVWDAHESTISLFRFTRENKRSTARVDLLGILAQLLRCFLAKAAALIVKN